MRNERKKTRLNHKRKGATSIASLSVAAASSVSVASAAVAAATAVAAASSSAAEVSSAAASEWSPWLFVNLGRDIVLCVHFASNRLFCNFKCAIPSDVQAHVASEQVYITILYGNGVSFFNFFNIIVP